MARRSLVLSGSVFSGAWWLVPILVVTAGLVPSGAQTTEAPGVSDATGDLAVGIDRLNRTLAEIRDSMQTIRRDQRALVLARWIEIEERRFASMEEDLRRAQAEKKSLEERSRELEARLEMLNAGIKREIEAGADPARINAQAAVEGLETGLNRVRSDAEQAAARALELESALVGPSRELQNLRDRLRDWIDVVEE